MTLTDVHWCGHISIKYRDILVDLPASLFSSSLGLFPGYPGLPKLPQIIHQLTSRVNTGRAEGCHHPVLPVSLSSVLTMSLPHS